MAPVGMIDVADWAIVRIQTRGRTRSPLPVTHPGREAVMSRDRCGAAAARSSFFLECMRQSFASRMWYQHPHPPPHPHLYPQPHPLPRSRPRCLADCGRLPQLWPRVWRQRPRHGGGWGGSRRPGCARSLVLTLPGPSCGAGWRADFEIRLSRRWRVISQDVRSHSAGRGPIHGKCRLRRRAALPRRLGVCAAVYCLGAPLPPRRRWVGPLRGRAAMRPCRGHCCCTVKRIREGRPCLPPPTIKENESKARSAAPFPPNDLVCSGGHACADECTGAETRAKAKDDAQSAGVRQCWSSWCMKPERREGRAPHTRRQGAAGGPRRAARARVPPLHTQHPRPRSSRAKNLQSRGTEELGPQEIRRHRNTGTVPADRPVATWPRATTFRSRAQFP